MNVVIYLIFCLLIGLLGNKRKIGFGWAFFWSLFLSPVIGLIITLISRKISPN
jgi:hypothetical protein